jgi:hypothetical protein
MRRTMTSAEEMMTRMIMEMQRVMEMMTMTEMDLHRRSKSSLVTRE